MYEEIIDGMRSRRWVVATSHGTPILNYDTCVGFKVMVTGNVVMADAKGTVTNLGSVTANTTLIIPQVPYKFTAATTATVELHHYE